MRRIAWSVSLNVAHNCKLSGELEVEDEATEEEVNEAVRQEVFDHIDWGWADA